MSLLRPRRPLVWAATLAVAAATLTPLAAAHADSALTDRVSIRTGGFPPGGGGDGGKNTHSERRHLSLDGRFVAFAASAPLAPGQAQLDWQVLVRDRMRGTTELVSRPSSGGKGNSTSLNPSISADGRYVAFESEASNLVGGDTNANHDVFVHDRVTRTTTRVSVTSSGAQGVSDHGSTNPSISADGRYVAFVSDAALAPGITVNTTRAFLHDRATGTTELVSLGSDGLPRSVVTGTYVSVSGNGSRVLFSSLDSDVTPDAHNLDPDIFLRDRAGGFTVRVAGNEDGARYATISADGQWVAYESPDNDIVPGDANDAKDVFLTSLATGQHFLASRTPAGASASQESIAPNISADGRYVIFHSRAADLVPGDTNGLYDVFRFDAHTGVVTRASIGTNGAQSTAVSYSGGISGDGQHVSFLGYDRGLSADPACCWNFTYVRDYVGAWPAMRARVRRLPARVRANKAMVVRTIDIAPGERVKAVWIRKGKTPGKKKVVRWATVRGGKARMKAGPKAGKYRVKVSYAGKTLRSSTVRTRR
ncbi:MAG: hypothetical protein LT071_09100 [Nocardioides sp.]|nr:hypothetical protein [Nocardioides sp.]